jgi:hypothetical protein
MDIHELSDFFKLSALLNIQLSATTVGRSNIATIILGQAPVGAEDRERLMAALEFVDRAYGQAKRRLGPLAVLHPLRACVQLSRVQDETNIPDLVTELLHDVLEDIAPAETEGTQEPSIEAEIEELLHRIDPRGGDRILDRLRALTRKPGETYLEYIGDLLDQAPSIPSLVSIKLADRLDNTLDMRIDIEDPMQGVDFFEALFQVLYVNNYTGYQPAAPHPPPSPLNGAQRLYQLFKNATLLSLVRQKGIAMDDPSARKLFAALARASMKEAQRNALHIFGYHMKDVHQQRELLLETMEYSQFGGIDRVTRPTNQWRLDGFFATQFDDSDPAVRMRRLEEFYKNKALMTEASIAFVVIFLSFLNEPSFRIKGVSEFGIDPEPPSYRRRPGG